MDLAGLMIDTHSHIYSEEFDADRDEVILRAQHAGVTKIILPNVPFPNKRNAPIL